MATAKDDSFDPSYSDFPLLDPFDPLIAFDDAAAFPVNLALDDDTAFPADWDGETPPYEGNLYSTPLSWEIPEAKLEPLPISVAPYNTMNTLTPAQQEKLRNIAMPHHLQYRTHASPHSTASNTSHSISSPDHDSGRKRKSSTGAEDDDEDDDSNPPVKKTAHNMIEKRYRTNLNDKIAQLRDSVPSLRIMTKSARGEDTITDREDLQGLTPAHKLNKATVLSKATEYINHLEKRNKRLQEENAHQKQRLDAFETLFRSGSMGFNQAPPMATQFQYPPDYTTPGPSPGSVDPSGMIQVPDDIRRLHNVNTQGQAYAVPEQYQQQRPGPNGWNNGGYFGKLMVGSLAGLMIMEGFAEAEQEKDSPGARGLLAVPTQLFRSLSSAFHSSLDINLLGYHVPAAQSLGYVKFFLVLGAVVYAFLPSLFSSKPQSKGGKTQSASLSAAPSLASSIQVRRQAWLTAIQTVWVPRHNFFLEAAALCLKMMKLSMRNVIGVQGYAYVTGITQQQEAARVKAWSIALDAQLAGGDVEVSKSRLILTLLASETLPDTPARLMLKALHFRVLFWEIGNAGFNGFYMFQEVAAKMARWKWNAARELRRLMAHTNNKQQEEELPEYLVALLEQDCDEVLADSIGQRAYNLAWNLPTTHNVKGSSEGIDGVIDDFAIRSPLDAVAAWYSSLVLQRALTKSLQTTEDDLSAQVTIADDVSLAIKVAPIGSGAQIRALVARSVLVKEKRGQSIAAAMQALGPLQKPGSKKLAPSLVNASTSMTGLPDVKMSLRCAMAIAHLERYPSPASPAAVPRIVATVHPVNLTLLGFAAAMKLMEKLNGHHVVANNCTAALERLAGGLRIWVGGKGCERSGLDKEVKREMVNRCLAITKRIVGMEDAGYGSMTEEDAAEGC